MEHSEEEYWNMLIDTIENKFQKSKLERSLSNANSKIKTLESSLKELEAKVQKEFNNVEILKTKSLPRFWHQIRQSLDKKIKQEEEKLLGVQMIYLKAEKDLASTKIESQNLQAMLESLTDIDEILYDLTFEQDVSEMNELRFLAHKIAQWHARLIDLKHVIQIGHKAEHDLHEAQKILLENADPFSFSVSLDISGISINSEGPSEKALLRINKAFDTVKISFNKFCQQLDTLSIDTQDLHKLSSQYPHLLKEQFKPPFWTSIMPQPPPEDFTFNQLSASKIESFRRLILRKIKKLRTEIKAELAKQSTLETKWAARWTAHKL